MLKTISLSLMLAIAAPVAFTACDRQVSETTHTRVDSNGNASQEKKTVTESPNGDITVQKERTEKTVDTR